MISQVVGGHCFYMNLFLWVCLSVKLVNLCIPRYVRFCVPILWVSLSPTCAFLCPPGTLGQLVGLACPPTATVMWFFLQSIEIIHFQNSLVGVKKLKMKTLIGGTCAINILLSRDIQCFMMVTICFQTTLNSIYAHLKADMVVVIGLVCL